MRISMGNWTLIIIDEHPLVLGPVHMKQVTEVAQMHTYILFIT